MSFISYDSAKLTPLKENNPSYQPSQEQILSYAQQILQLNLPADEELLYLAQQALKAPLPKDWQACEYFDQQLGQNIIEDESIIVYRNKKTKEVIYDHPLDIVYRQKARQLKLLKNTAKYSQNITPINEELMQSSVVGLNKNNSKHEENQQNKSSIRMANSSVQESKAKSNMYFPSRTSQLVKNITQQSVLYEQSSDGFQNLSMITDYQQLVDVQRSSQNTSRNNERLQQISYRIKMNEKNNEMIKKSPLKVLKQKPKVIRPIIVPTQKQKQMKRQKQKQRKIQRQKQVKQSVKNMIFSVLMKVNDKELQRMKQNLKSKLTLKDIQQRILITKEFGDNNNNNPSSIQMNRLYQKQAQLKRLQRQNKLMDQRIKQKIKLIEMQKSLSSNPLLFHDYT